MGCLRQCFVSPRMLVVPPLGLPSCHPSLCGGWWEDRTHHGMPCACVLAAVLNEFSSMEMRRPATPFGLCMPHQLPKPCFSDCFIFLTLLTMKKDLFQHYCVSHPWQPGECVLHNTLCSNSDCAKQEAAGADTRLHPLPIGLRKALFSAGSLVTCLSTKCKLHIKASIEPHRIPAENILLLILILQVPNYRCTQLLRATRKSPLPSPLRLPTS